MTKLLAIAVLVLVAGMVNAQTNKYNESVIIHDKDGLNAIHKADAELIESYNQITERMRFDASESVKDILKITDREWKRP